MTATPPRLGALRARLGPRGTTVLYSGVNAAVSLGLIGVLAVLTGEPLLFPSLGPTAFLLFHDPLRPAACPRNTVLGHLVGVLTGWSGLAVCGLLDVPPALTGIGWGRVAAAMLALGLTCGLLPLLRAPHPPAGATTLIVALGLLRSPVQLLAILAGVLLITAQGLVVNRLAGYPYPLWSAPPVPRAMNAMNK